MIENQGTITRTTEDKGRHYTIDGKDYPSVTSILQYYPKSEGFWRWKFTNPDSKKLFEDAGEYGTNVHKTIEKTFRKYLNLSEYLDLSENERKSVDLFTQWITNLQDTHKVEIIDVEKMVINKEEGYAGTIDLIVKIDGQLWIVDIKTSKSTWITQELQLSAYKHALESINKEPIDLMFDKENPRPYFTHKKEHDINYKLALLHINHNLDNYEFKEVEDKFELFLAVFKIFKYENSK